MTTINKEPKHYVYLLECQNGHFYTGYTTDPIRRYEEHKKGTAKSKYTRSFPPKRLAACWEILGGKSEALKIEKHIKKLSKVEKINLSENPDKLIDLIEHQTPLKPIYEQCFVV